MPFLTITGASHTFPDQAEREQARQALDSLNTQAEADPTSRFVGRYLAEVASYLNSEELTE